MANPMTQMTAGAHDSNSMGREQRAVSFDMPTAVKRGLDTGARGWRWLLTTPASRQMQGSDPRR